MGPRMWEFCMVPETAMRSRYDLSAPFSRGTYSYATNGHIIVRVPRICEDAEATWPKIENVTAAITHASLSPLPVLDVEDAFECPTCKGFGVVRPHMAFGYQCEGCKKCTWGYVPARKPCDDQEVCDTCEGRKVTWPKEAKIMLTPRCAIAPRYYRLIASLPNPRIDLTVDCVSTSWEKDQALNGVSFAFDGGDGLVMPIRIYSRAAEAA
jgi:hypothetical protein